MNRKKSVSVKIKILRKINSYAIKTTEKNVIKACLENKIIITMLKQKFIMTLVLIFISFFYNKNSLLEKVLPFSGLLFNFRNVKCFHMVYVI